MASVSAVVNARREGYYSFQPPLGWRRRTSFNPTTVATTVDIVSTDTDVSVVYGIRLSGLVGWW